MLSPRRPGGDAPADSRRALRIGGQSTSRGAVPEDGPRRWIVSVSLSSRDAVRADLLSLPRESGAHARAQRSLLELRPRAPHVRIDGEQRGNAGRSFNGPANHSAGPSLEFRLHPVGHRRPSARRRQRAANHSLCPILGQHNFVRAVPRGVTRRRDSELIGQLDQVRAVPPRMGPPLVAAPCCGSRTLQPLTGSAAGGWRQNPATVAGFVAGF